MIRYALVLLLAASGFMLHMTGCTPVCDNIPTEQLASVRILNGVPDVPTILVYVDSVLFDSAYYDINLYGSSQVNSSHAFGYRQSFLSTGNGLRIGRHHITAINAANHADLVLDTTMILTDRRQTLAYLGRHVVSNPEQKPVKMIYLDDVIREPEDKHSLVRFVHGVTDLPGIDVYFSRYAKLDNQKQPKPDLRFNFGQVSDNSGGGTGTGRLPSDYIAIDTSDGLLITAQGDTSDVILMVPYPLSTSRFLNTVIIRGESKPVATEPIVSTLILQDGAHSPGSYNYNASTFGVRIVNATKDIDSLSLLILGFADNRAPGPRNNYPLQRDVLNIPKDSVSRYLPLGPTYDATASYYLAPSLDNRTIFYSDSNKVFPVNHRFTYVGIKLNPSGTGTDTAHYGAFLLTDTVSQPADKNFGRIRFVNASLPGNVINFTYQGKAYNLKQQDVAYADAQTATSPVTITVTNGTSTGSVTFPVLNGHPVTLFFMPASATNPFPYTIADQN